jgi:hypothetical protein
MEDPSELGEAGELGVSREFRAERRMGVGGDRKKRLSEGELARLEEGKREPSRDGEGSGSREILGILSSGTPTTAISGISRSSEAILKHTTAKRVGSLKPEHKHVLYKRCETRAVQTLSSDMVITLLGILLASLAGHTPQIWISESISFRPLTQS